MGAIARAAANNITTSGVFTSSAIANSSVTGITALANASDGITFISSQTASNSASISFTSGLTSTYKAYKFVFSSIHPRTDAVYLTFQGSTDGGSNYGVAITNTVFQAYHYEDDSAAALQYQGSDDVAQSTSFVAFVQPLNSDADQATSGTLQLFNPSSTTYVKHFITQFSNVHSADLAQNWFTAGYMNTTSAINAVQFKMDSGNMHGTIYLYGIK